MIQTVTGGISATNLGNVLMHEHISCLSMSFGGAFGSKWLDKEQLKELSCQALKQTKEIYNLGLLVDGTPIDFARDVQLLKEVSECSGVKIVASTGFYYLQSIETTNNEPQALAKWLIDECQNGIGDTGVKPGILKCATGNMGITEDNHKKLSAMGTVQKETGLPIFVHCEHQEDIAHKQIAVLTRSGANIEKIIIGHAAILPDAEYLEGILKTGCHICIDQCHCSQYNINIVAEALVTLCRKGYTKKILLSNDYCIHSDFCNHNTNGLHLNARQHTENLGYIFRELHTAYMAVGGVKTDWETMVCKNPISILDI